MLHRSCSYKEIKCLKKIWVGRFKKEYNQTERFFKSRLLKFFHCSFLCSQWFLPSGIGPLVLPPPYHLWTIAVFILLCSFLKQTLMLYFLLSWCVLPVQFSRWLWVLRIPYTNKQLADTSKVSKNSTQFWQHSTKQRHQISQVKTQSLKTSFQMPASNSRFLTNQLQTRGSHAPQT